MGGEGKEEELSNTESILDGQLKRKQQGNGMILELWELDGLDVSLNLLPGIVPLSLGLPGSLWGRTNKVLRLLGSREWATTCMTSVRINTTAGIFDTERSAAMSRKTDAGRQAETSRVQ
jgi:hypothetical protein